MLHSCLVILYAVCVFSIVQRLQRVYTFHICVHHNNMKLTYTHIHTHSHTLTLTHTHTHAHTHTHTHICIYTGGLEGSWIDKTKWCTSSPTEEWKGVFLDPISKRVNKLILPSNNLSGKKLNIMLFSIVLYYVI
jgi:hypothetical protein